MESVHKDISINVIVRFCEDRSDIDEKIFVWGCRFKIANNSDKIIQIVARYLHFTGHFGNQHDDYADSVQGEKPIIMPNKSYEYEYMATLDVPSAICVGKHILLNESREEIELDIPVFSMDSPYMDYAYIN